MAEEQISFTSLVFILVLSGLAMRYLFFGSNGSAEQQQQQQQQRQRNSQAVQRSLEVAYDRVQQMFPQVDRRTAMWDLQRNGGNITATTERILAGRLEVPPVTFQPPPAPMSPPSTTSSNGNGANGAAYKSSTPDLITRYNLQDKLTAAPAEQEAATAQTTAKAGKAWSTNKEERQSLLQKRRDEMILTARRKMEAKIAAEEAAKEAAAGGA